MRFFLLFHFVLRIASNSNCDQIIWLRVCACQLWVDENAINSLFIHWFIQIGIHFCAQCPMLMFDNWFQFVYLRESVSGPHEHYKMTKCGDYCDCSPTIIVYGSRALSFPWCLTIRHFFEFIIRHICKSFAQQASCCHWSSISGRSSNKQPSDSFCVWVAINLCQSSEKKLLRPNTRISKTQRYATLAAELVFAQAVKSSVGGRLVLSGRYFYGSIY